MLKLYLLFMQTNKTNKKIMDIRIPNNIARKKTGKSNTLMRKYVQKPLAKTKSKLTPKIGTKDLDILKKINSKNNDSRINLNLISKTKNIPKSSMISRFNSKNNLDFIKNTAPVSKGIEISKLVKPILDENVIDPSKKLIESSIEKINSDDFKYLPKKDTKLRKLVIAFVLIVIAVLLVSLYNNLYPKLKISFASNVACFNAITPKYIPPGYTLGPVTAHKGSISSEYNSNTSKLKFTITESPSAWNAATLIDTYLVPNAHTDFSLINSNGINIYIYGNNNATWVTGGIWYLVDGNSTLSNNELVKLATSM